LICNIFVGVASIVGNATSGKQLLMQYFAINTPSKA
jgi:hypothetical protein